MITPPLGVFVTHRLVLAMINRCIKLERLNSPTPPMLTRQIISGSVHCVAIEGRKPPNLAVFST